MNNNPIGFFDSGVGGTSIWKEVHALLPRESTIYLADSRNAPYGEKSKEEIIKLSIKNTRILLDKKCKMIVVACNTATTNAIKELRAQFDIPFIGIEPAIKPAANNTRTQTIGVLATKGTLSSELFNKAVEFHQETRIVEQVGHGLVQLIENGEINSPKMTKLLESYLLPMVDQNIDFLVLGCSHYPYLIPKIKQLIPAHIQIIDSGQAVARQTRNVLIERQLLSNSESTHHKFLTNVDKTVLEKILDNSYEVIIEDF
jgi:glutamate racemase